MVPFRQAGEVALILLVTFIGANVRAQDIEQDDARHDFASGISLDRLSAKDQKTWQAIRSIIYSKDADGRALHPKLRELYEQLQESEHTIYLEFDESRSGCRCTGGNFSIERLDPEGISHVAVIKLHLKNVEYAFAPAQPNLRGDFVPLAGLNELDRYTEVLAHEMAHAVDILFNQERAKMVDELLRRTDLVVEELLHRRAGRIEPELEQELHERDAILHELEKPAQSAEAVVWRELVLSRRKRRTEESKCER
jgi:hypothetical protein